MFNILDDIYQKPIISYMNKEIVEYPELLEGILNGITDVIRVYNPNYTIAFLNTAAEKIYKNLSEEILDEEHRSTLPSTEKSLKYFLKKVMESKKMFSIEKYIPEINKYMDICYSPILDDDKEVIFIIERSRDITEKKMLLNLFKESEEKYRQIVNISPDAIIITNDNNIVLANNEACKLFGTDYDNFIGTNIYKYIPTKLVKTFHKRTRNIIINKVSKVTYDYEILHDTNKISYVQITSSYILYQGKPAILSVIRDVSESKKDLIRASEFQKKSMQTSFPLCSKVIMETVYLPANIVSGDFYHIYKITNDLAIGVLTDVSGKGIKAALSISAFEVLLYEEILNNHDPGEIIKNLNKRLLKFPRENYIAAICFSMDFTKNEFTVVGAGINQFIIHKNNASLEEVTVKGAFLGMFEDSIFDKKVIPFSTGDRFYLFTDGLDFILDKDKVIENFMQNVSINTFKNYINEFLNDTIIELGNLKDDCSMIALEIK